jgi:bifunctional N-acetylglucosamine-1-phosphate-uridyltransferase/glucosamine-1-phosphate-acetyltransferase GlmU-like protein
VTIVALVTNGKFDDADLCGKPVWMRTMEAAAKLRPRKTLWLGEAPAGLSSATVVSGRALASTRDTVVLLAADLPCLTAPSLRGLVKSARNAPRALVAPRGPSGPSEKDSPVVAAPSRAFRDALRHGVDGAITETVRRLAPEPVFASGADELLRVGSAVELARATLVLRRRKVEALLRRGVVMADPASVIIDPEVSVGTGTILKPWVLLEGQTKVASGCTIGSFCHIEDSSIGAETVLLDHCYVRASRIGKRARLGPFSHLRPDSEVGLGAHVGNFVELKKTRLGDGAKASHLAYLGDAVIGKGVNVGAGAITCNYDGKVKHRTIVGDGAFIGSDVQLVAPVRVGKGAYVAAGSCIVRDVPPHSLAIARSRQIVKRGWAKKRR